MKHILCVVGARPNFMKMAPLLRALAPYQQEGKLKVTLVHTGQHYDEVMQGQFFRELGLSAPDHNLEVGSGSHAEQTAMVMTRFEPLLQEQAVDLVVVVGDVNSTLACSLVAAKCHVPVAHVEAGLRSGDLAMPEEINRIVTDRLSRLLFTTEPSGEANLRQEGVDPAWIFPVGNIMIDNLAYQMTMAPSLEEVVARHGLSSLSPGEYGVLTLHRPSNVDNELVLGDLVDTLIEVANDLPLLFPVHPRTAQRLVAYGLEGRLRAAGVRIMPPLGYRDLLTLVRLGALVMTDSGGLQEETSFLEVPCLTLRENTERPVTLSQGSNRLVGTCREAILTGVADVLGGRFAITAPPPLWDGNAAERIASQLMNFLNMGDTPCRAGTERDHG